MRMFLLSLFLFSPLSVFAATPAITVSPCLMANIHNLPCLMYKTEGFPATYTNGLHALPPIPNMGKTLTEIEANFPGVILSEFTALTSTELNAQFALLDPSALARFSQAYYMEGGNYTTLNALAASKLTAANYARFLTAFDVATATPLVESHAWHASRGAVMKTANGLSGGAAAPTTGMTLYEIYTEYLFTSATTTLEAVYSTALYAYSNLAASWAIGYYVGTQLYGFGTEVDPDFGYDLATYFGAPELPYYNSGLVISPIGPSSGWDDDSNWGISNYDNWGDAGGNPNELLVY
jgi:hypothetical protein